MILSFIRGLLGGRTQPVPRSRPTNASDHGDGHGQGNANQNAPQLEKTELKTLLEPPAAEGSEPIVLSFRMAVPQPPKRSKEATCTPSLPPDESSRDARAEPAPRAKRDRRTLSLRAAGLGSAPQRRALQSIGIRTTEDVLAAEPTEVAQRLGSSASAARTLRRWQRAIRLSRRLPEMTPREALLLQAVHRGTLRQIGKESAPRLRRDLARFAISTAGSRLLADQALPSPEQVKGWVEAARKRIEAQVKAAD